MKKILALSSVSLLIAGCGALDNNPIYGDNGIVRDRSQDYELAETSQRLEVPEHLSVKQTEESLTIPEISDVATARTGDFIVPRPEFFYAESGTESVSLKREGGDKLIIVDEGITNVWVKLQEFWQFNGIDIVKSDPRQGVMETQWITHEAKELSFVDSWVKRLTFQDLPGATKDKLQVSLKPVDGDPNRTSIAMQHIRFAEDNDAAEVDWSEQARGVSYKSDMMFEMLRYLGKATGDRSAQTLVAFQEQRRLGTQLGRDSRGNAVLKLDADVESAWNNVSAALDKADMDVGTRDPDLGLFYMTYTTSTPFENEEEMGFFEWLHAERGPIKIDTSAISAALGVGSDDSEGISYTSGKTAARFQNTESQISASAFNNPDDAANKKGYKIWFAGKPIYVFGGNDSGVYNENSGKFEHTGQYQLKLIRTRTGVYLSVLTAEGVAAPAVIGEEILWEIKEQLPRS